MQTQRGIDITTHATTKTYHGTSKVQTSKESPTAKNKPTTRIQTFNKYVQARKRKTYQVRYSRDTTAQLRATPRENLKVSFGAA